MKHVNAAQRMHPIEKWWIRVYRPHSPIAAMVGRWTVIATVLILFVQILVACLSGALARAVQ